MKKKIRLISGFMAMILFFVSSLSLALNQYNNNHSNRPQNPVCLTNPNLAICQNNQKDNAPGSLSASTSDLGLTGPLTLKTIYSDDLGLIGVVQFTKALNPANAISILLDLGAKERRANITFAHQFNKTTRAKMTYEYLQQKLGFDFATGTVNDWIGQNAFGFDVEKLIHRGILKSIELKGQYVKANSKNLSPITFQQNGNSYIDYRHIAGGTEKQASLQANLQPNKTLQISPSINYGTLHYHTIYDNSQNDYSQVGFGLKLTKLISPTWKLNASLNDSVDSKQASVGINHIVGHHFEIGAQGTYIHGSAGLPTDTQFLVSLSYPAPKEYSFGNSDNQFGSISDYAKQPAVYMSQVLAVKDEKIANISINTNQIANQNIVVGNPMAPIYTGKHFTINEGFFDKVEYTINATTISGAKINLADLGLNFIYSGHYQGFLSSQKFQNKNIGKYLISITANGIKKGKVLATATETFQLAITQNENLLPQWNKSFTHLPIIYMHGNSTGYPYDLSKEVNNPNAGGQLSFKIDNSLPFFTINNSELQINAAKLTPGEKIPVNLSVKNTATNHWVANKNITVDIIDNSPPKPTDGIRTETLVQNVATNFSLSNDFQSASPITKYSIVKGQLPQGLSFNPTTGVISGKTTAAVNTYTLEFSASNQYGTSQTNKELKIKVTYDTNDVPVAKAGTLTINGYVLHSMTTPIDLHDSFTLPNPNLPIKKFTLASGHYAPGTSANANGIINGTYTQTGTFKVAVKAENEAGPSQSARNIEFNVSYDPADIPAPKNPITVSGHPGETINPVDVTTKFTLKTPAIKVNSYTVKNLPQGVSYDSAKHIISGTLPASGNYSAEITATNAAGTSQPFKINFVVSNATPEPKTATYSKDINLVFTPQATITDLGKHFTNVNSNTIYKAVSNLPGGISINGNNLNLTKNNLSYTTKYNNIKVQACNGNVCGKPMTIKLNLFWEYQWTNSGTIHARPNISNGISVVTDAMGLPEGQQFTILNPFFSGTLISSSTPNNRVDNMFDCLKGPGHGGQNCKHLTDNNFNADNAGRATIGWLTGTSGNGTLAPVKFTISAWI